MSVLTQIANGIAPSSIGVDSSWNYNCLVHVGYRTGCTWTDTVWDEVLRVRHLLQGNSLRFNREGRVMVWIREVSYSEIIS